MKRERKAEKKYVSRKVCGILCAAVALLAAAVIASIQTYASIMAALAVWLLIGFALTGHLCSSMFYRAFRRFTRKEDLPEDTVDEAMYALRDQYRKEKMLKKQGH